MSSEPETKKVKRTRVVAHILAHDWETTGMNLLTHWAPEFDITGQYRPTRDMSSFYFGVGKHFQVRGSTDAALQTFGEMTPVIDLLCNNI